MPIGVVCPQCGKQMQVKAELAGRKGKCPQCQTVFVLEGQPAAVAKAPTPKSPVAKSPAAVASGAPLNLEQARQQILGAFTGSIAPVRVGLFRKLGVVIVLGVLLLMPVFYLAVIGAVMFGMYWLATSGIGQELPPAGFWAIQVAAALVLIGLVKPLVEPQRRTLRGEAQAFDGHPGLREFLSKICEQLGAPLPERLRLECSTHLEIAPDRGRFGMAKGGLVLTLGLPLVACLSAEQFAGLLSDQLSFRRRHAASTLTNVMRSINGWLWQTVYGKSRFDQWLALVAERKHFHLAKLLLPLWCLKWVAQAVLFVPMFVANTIASSVGRRAEYDADRLTVRLVGKRTFATLLAQRELIDFAWEGVLAELAFLHTELHLPDSLPQQLAVRMIDTTPELYAALRDTISDRGDRPFDSRATNEERLAAIESEPPEGMLHCKLPATALFNDFPAAARQMTWDYYVSRFGPELLKTAITQVAVPTSSSV